MSFLETAQLGKDFGALRAVHDIDLRVERGERRAIIGPNGAGKTTLFHLLSGHLPPTRGRILLDGQDITRLAAHRRARAGMARSFQVTNLLQEMTTLEMCVLAVYGRRGTPFAFVRSLLDHRAERARAEQLLDAWGLGEQRERPIQVLSYGEQRLLEIVVALAQDPRLILLDEPTSGLSQVESRQVVEAIKRLPNVTLVLIEHDMSVVFEVVDSITVMHQGQELATGTPSAIRADAQVQQIYMGELVEGQV
jgi:branched-chain amino acid transport system ATP-binding protein